ncbi:MAG: hypothetical protein A4E62_02940 [Syntrophorhabdus sp. PtaU1.Bin002]|nr:MAG: hypothetical protein A4E62_02940 [Syntrophorhabdus sp. PtaU1.Bin002]
MMNKAYWKCWCVTVFVLCALRRPECETWMEWVEWLCISFVLSGFLFIYGETKRSMGRGEGEEAMRETYKRLQEEEKSSNENRRTFD